MKNENQLIWESYLNSYNTNNDALDTSVEQWLEHAEETGINKLIIAFVKSNPDENFYAKPAEEWDPYPSGKQLSKLSQNLKIIFKQYKDAKIAGETMPVSIYKAIGDQAASKCGVLWARKFVQFLKSYES